MDKINNRGNYLPLLQEVIDALSDLPKEIREIQYGKMNFIILYGKIHMVSNGPEFDIPSLAYENGKWIKYGK